MIFIADVIRYEFLGRICIIEVDEISDDLYKNALVIVLDSSDTNMINDERYKLGRYVIKVDHHISNANYGDMNIVETSEVSCASLIAKIIFSLILQ